MQIFHLAVLNALRMSMLINAQNPLRLPFPFLAFMAMLTTAWIASTVDLPFLNPNWFSERPFSPTKRAWSRCIINSSRSFPVVSNEHISLYDEAIHWLDLVHPLSENYFFHSWNKVGLIVSQHCTNVGNQQPISYIGPTFNRSSQSAECHDFCLGNRAVLVFMCLRHVNSFLRYSWE